MNANPGFMIGMVRSNTMITFLFVQVPKNILINSLMLSRLMASWDDTYVKEDTKLITTALTTVVGNLIT